MMKYDFYYWGPYLFKTNIDTDLCKQILEKGRKTIKPFNHQLAGHLKKENLFEEEDKKFVFEKLKEHFYLYTTTMREQYGSFTKKVNEIQIENLWINFMKKGEFNPPHIHTLDLSFVLFLQVTKELEEEHGNFKGRDAGPGTLQFSYGEQHNDMFVSYHTFFPKVGQLFIFPSKLRHMVFPFQSEGERISISGNLKFL